MNRLTDKNYIFSSDTIISGTTGNVRLFKILEKLQAYEDTGLEPEEVETLKAENAELKRLLSLAVQGFKYIDKYFGCGGCAENWQDCPYNAGKIDVCTEHWKHADEAEKVLGGSENA